MEIEDRFKGCILGGAIGDAWGSAFENVPVEDNSTAFPFGVPEAKKAEWAITDDTQLTLATCEALAEQNGVEPEIVARYFVKYYKEKRLSGIGASTYKALQELAEGGHWLSVGRSGEYAAGNGAAMRIAPLAFMDGASKKEVEEVSKITHKNDEAYAGALAVFIAIRAVINKEWDGHSGFIHHIVPYLPDTKVKDRLQNISLLESRSNIGDIAELGTSGYVVDSVPLAIFAASKVRVIGISHMFEDLIAAGGDTDTNASIAGQIAGALLGYSSLPKALLSHLEQLHNYAWMEGITDAFANRVLR